MSRRILAAWRADVSCASPSSPRAREFPRPYDGRMSRRPVEPATPDPAPNLDQKRLFSPFIAWTLWGILALLAGWRCFLAVSIGLQTDVAGMFALAVVHWRRPDE